MFSVIVTDQLEVELYIVNNGSFFMFVKQLIYAAKRKYS